MTIALDAMGGDFGPSVVVPAALNVLKQESDLKVILVGQEDVLHEHLTRLKVSENPRLSIYHCTEVVGMDEPPAQALRFKKDSSMRVAINLVKEGRADACVSAGNTGALMATARFVLKTLPGIDRPAISSLMPTQQNHPVRMLDLGANVDSTPEQVFQFAVMGSVMAHTVDGIENPRIGLLNIGSEDIKGTEQIKATARLLAECSALNYIGYIEGDDIHKGNIDVVVCDGFVGNISLKTTEGVAKLIKSHIKKGFERNLLTKCMALLVWPILRKIAQEGDPRRYNGASFLGLKGIVVKSHGSADIFSYSHAIKEAILEVKSNVPKKIADEVSGILQQGKSE